MIAFAPFSAGLCRVETQPCIAGSRASTDFQQGMQGMQGWARAYAEKNTLHTYNKTTVFSLARDGLTLHTLHTLLKANASKAYRSAGLVLNPAQPC